MRSLPKFFALTFLATWTSWGAAAWVTGGVAPTLAGAGGPPGVLLLYLGIFAPAMVAVGLTARAEGRAGVGALLGRLFRADVAARWYLFALGYMAAVKLAAAVVHRVVAGGWPAFAPQGVLLMLAGALFSTLIGGQVGEEVGWRGYALPRLAERLGVGGASVLLGLVWAAWHLPLFYLPGADTYGQSFPVYALQVTALSVAIAWLYAHTGGSLLLTMLMHASINNTSGIVPSVPRAAANPLLPHATLLSYLTLVVAWAGAAYLLRRMPGSRGQASRSSVSRFSRSMTSPR